MSKQETPNTPWPVSTARYLPFGAWRTTPTQTLTDRGWDIFGEAVGGAPVGVKLEPVVKGDHFWFSWAAFRPETRIYRP